MDNKLQADISKIVDEAVTFFIRKKVAMPSSFFSRTKYLLYTYGLFLLFFAAQKVVFLLYHLRLSSQSTLADCLRVLWHGLRMDVTVAGYLSLLPLLVLLVSVFFSGKIFARILHAYFAAVALLTAVIFVGDLVLYGFWNFKLDSTVLTYITNPKGAAASVSAWVVAASIAAVLLCALAQLRLLHRCVAKPLAQGKKSAHRAAESVLLFALIAPMLVGIRGGVTASTMNVGAVYFSQSMFLNHAAVNPCFSLLSSLQYADNFGEQYRFMSDEEAKAVLCRLSRYDKSSAASSVLKTPRPNVIFILLESCGAQFVEPLGGAKGVMPNLERIAGEGIFFTNMYANSFRTDRGITSCLAGFPAQPTMSILKYPKKCEALSSIPKLLHEQGYATSYLHGGDVDFAQVSTFFVSQKVTDIVSQKNLPQRELQSAWGAHDHLMFERLLQQVKGEKRRPYLKMLLTLSSHEPFVVPFSKFDDRWLNAVAYTDSCLGVFVDALKQTPQWDSTLLVLVPDHAASYPNLTQHEPRRHQAYMVWAGGAVKAPQRVERFCSQSDIAATLLHQMGLSAEAFPFSKDALNPHAPSFAFYSFINGFGMVSPQGSVAFDCNTNQPFYEAGRGTDSLVVQGKAFLQKLYDAIEAM